MSDAQRKVAAAFEVLCRELGGKNAQVVRDYVCALLDDNANALETRIKTNWNGDLGVRAVFAEMLREHEAKQDADWQATMQRIRDARNGGELARLRAELERAKRALIAGGYVDNGAEEWKPPLRADGWPQRAINAEARAEAAEAKVAQWEAHRDHARWCAQYVLDRHKDRQAYPDPNGAASLLAFLDAAAAEPTTGEDWRHTGSCDGYACAGCKPEPAAKDEPGLRERVELALKVASEAKRRSAPGGGNAYMHASGLCDAYESVLGWIAAIDARWRT